MTNGVDRSDATCRDIGSFVNLSGWMVVMDPAYDRTLIDRLGARCPVHTGTWHASVVRGESVDLDFSWGVRVWSLTVKHERVAAPGLNFTPIKEIAVDTGMAVVCDDPLWRSDGIAGETPGYESLETTDGMSDLIEFITAREGIWAGITLSLANVRNTNAGVFNRGAVASSGVGDGGYILSGYSEADRFSAFKVVFL